MGRAVPHTTPSVAKARARCTNSASATWVRRPGRQHAQLRDDDGRVHVTHLEAPRTAVVDVTGAVTR